MPVILTAHGTRDPAGAAVARQLAGLLDARLFDAGLFDAGLLGGGLAGPVRLAFADVLAPGVRDVLGEVLGPVTVIPAFLASGYHVRTDVLGAVTASGRRDVTVTEALGPHPLLVGALRDRLRAAGWRPGDGVVLAAAGSSDPRSVAEVRIAAARLAALTGSLVRVGFVATGRPGVPEAVAGLRAAGYRRVVVASWLLAPGLFQRRLGDAGADTVSAPLATHPAVVTRLVGLLAAAHPPPLISAPGPKPPRAGGWSGCRSRRSIRPRP